MVAFISRAEEKKKKKKKKKEEATHVVTSSDTEELLKQEGGKYTSQLEEGSRFVGALVAESPGVAVLEGVVGDVEDVVGLGVEVADEVAVLEGGVGGRDGVRDVGAGAGGDAEALAVDEPVADARGQVGHGADEVDVGVVDDAGQVLGDAVAVGVRFVYDPAPPHVHAVHDHEVFVFEHGLHDAALALVRPIDHGDAVALADVPAPDRSFHLGLWRLSAHGLRVTGSFRTQLFSSSSAIFFILLVAAGLPRGARPARAALANLAAFADILRRPERHSQRRQQCPT
eukprot:CAMPEP_0198652482 /NCGR_PEP_ID=MMETSP1467-20131203/6406_1 /TAXON_ID=1462469 /ORGANISM="unid. sp., Strain CCMP2135" /LENGTH=284 /DNA_ID=CAMNT_0044388403 /DNA_START=248 /DNA_END=1101 /DNA_ORIENTATION=-